LRKRQNANPAEATDISPHDTIDDAAICLCEPREFEVKQGLGAKNGSKQGIVKEFREPVNGLFTMIS
jgi:hypothetical protein